MTVATGLPVVAVVGRPNVGKSSLVNRILGRREAIVQETPGVTRDRRSFEARWQERAFELIDTGGLEPGATGMDARIAEQAQVAMALADVILLVVDGTTGPTQADLEVASDLRGTPIPVIVVVNKIDNPRDVSTPTEFYSLGLGDPHGISALHGTGTGDLLDRIVQALPEHRDSSSAAWASIALVGRPNVGKSSVLNRLLGEQRSIVDSTPGTTRDPIDSFIEAPNGQRLRIVDTAGMRREVQIKDPIEYFSLLRSRGTLERVDAAILVVDAGEGMTTHDQRIASEILEKGRACVVALNKWDLVVTEGPDRDRLDRDFDQALRFLEWAPLLRISALTGRGIEKLLGLTTQAVDSHRRRLPTAEVNRLLRDAQQERPHPRHGGRAIRILYAAQVAVSPPTVVLFSNGPLEVGYMRYLEKRLRQLDAFEGTPIRMHYRVRTRD
jgi:GTPase